MNLAILPKKKTFMLLASKLSCGLEFHMEIDALALNLQLILRSQVFFLSAYFSESMPMGQTWRLITNRHSV